jgi:hypothetical protein
MERFLTRHGDRVLGTLTGFDRVRFRGTLRSISHCRGLERFLTMHHVLLKDFKPFAERLSTALKDHAEQVAHTAGRPFEYLPSSRISKEARAEQLAREHGVTEGLVCVLSCVEPCQTFAIRKDAATQRLGVTARERKCLHLYFYYLDRDFGLMHVRVQTWLPFTIHVCVNGRDWLARQLAAAGIPCTQVTNTFTTIGDLPRAQRLADQLVRRPWARWLTRWARRVHAPTTTPAALALKNYYWSVDESEVATDVMFRDADTLQQLYPPILRHAIEHFRSPDVLRFLGRRMGPQSTGAVETHFLRRPEGVRVKHRVEENSIKMYDKAGQVLRVETTINQPRRFKVYRRCGGQGRWIPMRKGLLDLARRVDLSRAANARYLDALSVVGEPSPVSALLDPVSRPVHDAGRRYRSLRPITEAESALWRELLSAAYVVRGFRHHDLRRWCTTSDDPPDAERRRAGRVTRLLRLLRAHGLIQKLPASRCYRVTLLGRRVMSAALTVRHAEVATLAA